MSIGGIHHHARGERHMPALTNRTFRIQKGIHGQFHHFYFLEEGPASLRLDEVDHALAGPMLLSLPPQNSAVMTIPAGSHGHLVGASPQIMVDAIGDWAESYALRILVEKPSFSSWHGSEAVQELRPLLRAFADELADPARSSFMVISSCFRLVLMGHWRQLGGANVQDRGRGDTAPVLQRFRQLVEIGYREHRTVHDYAHELGLTTDRLHAICRRALGRSPLQLLHERVVQEARLRLERSGRTIQEISDSLGFRDPTYFSHFFKRKAGLSPFEYRRLVRNAADPAIVALSSSYADWP